MFKNEEYSSFLNIFTKNLIYSLINLQAGTLPIWIQRA